MQVLRCFYPVQDPKRGLRPCGMCANCMVVKHMQWKFRLTQEVLASDLALWLTLQYDDYHLPTSSDGRACVSKLHCQNFFRKVRKQLKERFNDAVTCKHFLVSEYGPKTNRPHYHVLFLFRLPKMEIKPLLIVRQEIYEMFKSRWYHGHVEEKLFHSGVIRYLTKYVFKPKSDFDPPVPCFRLISNGIGEWYIDTINKDQVLRDGWRTPEGVVPRYYRDKLFPTLSGAAFWNVKKRSAANELRQLERENKVAQDIRKCRTIEEYIKQQQYLLRCQRRMIERKEKEKYG